MSLTRGPWKKLPEASDSASMLEQFPAKPSKLRQPRAQHCASHRTHTKCDAVAYPEGDVFRTNSIDMRYPAEMLEAAAKRRERAVREMKKRTPRLFDLLKAKLTAIDGPIASTSTSTSVSPPSAARAPPTTSGTVSPVSTVSVPRKIPVVLGDCCC